MCIIYLASTSPPAETVGKNKNKEAPPYAPNPPYRTGKYQEGTGRNVLKTTFLGPSCAKAG